MALRAPAPRGESSYRAGTARAVPILDRLDGLIPDPLEARQGVPELKPLLPRNRAEILAKIFGF